MRLVVHPDQTYCVPDWYIHNNIALIRDILELDYWK